MTGIEPAFPEYKTGALPLDDIARRPPVCACGILSFGLQRPRRATADQVELVRQIDEWIQRDSNPHLSG